MADSLSFKKFAKKAENKIKAAQNQAGKKFKAAQQSQTAKSLIAGQNKVVKRLSGRSESEEQAQGQEPAVASNVFLQATNEHGAGLFEVDNPFQHKKNPHLPAKLQQTAHPNFSGELNANTVIAEKKHADGQSKNIVAYIRDEWIRSQVKAREAEFTEYQSTNVFIGTWNVNGKKPTEPLEAWLNPGTNAPLPDIYVIGFQEIVDLNAANVVSESSSRERSHAWAKAISVTLNRIAGLRPHDHGVEPSRYLHLGQRYLVGIMVCVFVLNKHRNFVRGFQTSTAATGVMGVMGNKGGAGVRFRFYDSSFCFVCAHMAAHRENVEGRNADFQNIMQKLSFKDEAQISAQRHAGDYTNERRNSSYGVSDHDFVFWLGDFNYRINSQYTIEEVFNRIEAYDFDWLQQNDQLNQEKAAGRVFQGFYEKELNFLPTYKYIVGQQVYDRRPEKKVRAPAWCDRILFCSPTNDDHETKVSAITMENYSRTDLVSSDHKPIYGHASMIVKRTIIERKRDTISDIVRTLDKWENECIPKITLSKTALNFDGGVKYCKLAASSFEIRNEGQVPATWRFVPKLDDLSLCRSWLSVSSEYGMLLPGKSEMITVSCYVNTTMARPILAGTEFLDEILILRVENGRDHFISVSTTLLPTSFGQDLTILAQQHVPFRLPEDERKKLIAARETRLGKSNAELPNPIPREIWRLMNHLFLFGGCTTQRLFVESNISRDEMEIIRDCLDTGVDIPPPPQCQLVSVGATLLDLLSSLPVAIIPPEFYPNLDFDMVSIKTWTQRFLEQLPALNYNIFVYIVLFLRELVQPANSSQNGINPEKLCRVFGSVLFRPKNVQVSMKKKSDNLSNWILRDGPRDSSDPPEMKLLYHMLSTNVMEIAPS